jgi:hypothetical protein
MANTRTKGVRMDESLWDRFGEIAPDRSAAVRHFVHWYVGDEGWELPKRPDQSASADHDGRRGTVGREPRRL